MDDVENFELLKKAIFANCPVLEDILNIDGGKSLIEYANSYKQNNTLVDSVIKQEFIAEIKSSVEQLLGAEVAESVGNQLLNYYYVSTTDHHGPISHPFFVHADLLAGIKQEESSKAPHDNLIVLACSNVSLGNSSLPRSLLFHYQNQPVEGYERINFYPARDRLSPVFRLRPFTISDIKRMQDEIEVKCFNGTYSKKLRDKLKFLLESIYNIKGVLNARTFADQITITNFYLWQELFKVSRGKLSNLIYLEQEKIVTHLLVKHHLFSDTDVNKFIFKSDILDKIEDLFDGIPGAFTNKEDKGTFLFWYLPQGSKRRIALRREKQELVSADSTFRISLQPEIIKILLEQMKLIPSTMLSLAVLHCYYGVKCLGGFSQVNYLTNIEKAWNKIFNNNFSHDVSKNNPIQSICGDFIIGLLKMGNELLPATALDFILYGAADSYDVFKKTTENLTVAESIALMFPELYKILYKKQEREIPLEKMSQEKIFKVLNLEKRMSPCLNEMNL